MSFEPGVFSLTNQWDLIIQIARWTDVAEFAGEMILIQGQMKEKKCGRAEELDQSSEGGVNHQDDCRSVQQ